MKFTNEDIELIEKFIDIRNRGYYADGAQLTEVYNRVLEKRVNPTNCGSCIRQRINELEEALNRFKRQIALEEEQKKIEEPVKEDNKKPKAKK